MAVLLDREMRGTRFYQTCSTCRSCCRSRSSASSGSCSTRPTSASSTASCGPQRQRNSSDWYGNPQRSTCGPCSWRPAGATSGYIMVLYLAGLKSVDPVAPRGGQGRRRERAPDLLQGRLPGHAADQHRDRRHHHDRGPPRVRHRLHHQSGAQRPRTAVDAHHQQQHQRVESASASARPSPSFCSSSRSCRSSPS